MDTQDSVGTSLDESITPSFTMAGFSGIRSWSLLKVWDNALDYGPTGTKHLTSVDDTAHLL